MATKKASVSATAKEKNQEVEAPEEKIDEMNANTKMRDIFAELNEPFPQEVERVLPKGGAELIYIPVSEVINRLNRVLGIDGWSSEIISCQRDPLDSDFIVAHVRIIAKSLGGVVKDGFGGYKVKRTRNGEIVDLGNDFKSAVSDALKKAAQQLGVGLYLARSEDALILEARQDSIDDMSPEAQKIASLYKNFVGLREQLNETGLELIRSYWKNISGSRPVPKPTEFTEEELNGLIAEATQIILGASSDSAN